MSLLAWLKRLLMRVMLVREFCRDCGRTVSPIWQAPDRLWLDVMGENAAPRCLACFHERARRQGWWLLWQPERMDGCSWEETTWDDVTWSGPPGP